MEQAAATNLTRQLSGEAELRASLAYALVLQDGGPLDGAAHDEPPQLQPPSAQHSEPEPALESSGAPLASAPIIDVELHDSVDADTAQLAPENFSTTVPAAHDASAAQEIDDDDATPSLPGSAQPLQLEAKADVVLRCGTQEYRGLPARVFAAESGWVRRALAERQQQQPPPQQLELELPCGSCR
jgi:hypothetical protein